MTLEQADKIWVRFVQILGEKTFNAKELAAGSAIKNFFGSVDSHKAAFDQAVKEVLGS